MATALQEQQQQESVSKPLTYPTYQPAAVTTPRSRRKPQTPRPSVKTEAPAIADRSGIRSNSKIVQNLLIQNAVSATDTRVPGIGSQSPVGLDPRWGNETIATNHLATAQTLTHMSEALHLQNAGTNQYPISLHGSSFAPTGSLAGPKPVAKRGRTDSGRQSAEYLPSMVLDTPTVSVARTGCILSCFIFSCELFLEIQGSPRIVS